MLSLSNNSGREPLILLIVVWTQSMSRALEEKLHAALIRHQRFYSRPLVCKQCRTHTRGVWQATYVDWGFALFDGEESGVFGDRYRPQNTAKKIVTSSLNGLNNCIHFMCVHKKRA